MISNFASIKRKESQKFKWKKMWFFKIINLWNYRGGSWRKPETHRQSVFSRLLGQIHFSVVRAQRRTFPFDGKFLQILMFSEDDFKFRTFVFCERLELFLRWDRSGGTRPLPLPFKRKFSGFLVRLHWLMNANEASTCFMICATDIRRQKKQQNNLKRYFTLKRNNVNTK